MIFLKFCPRCARTRAETVTTLLLEKTGTLRYPGRGGKEKGESLERGRRHLRGKNKLRLSRLG